MIVFLKRIGPTIALYPTQPHVRLSANLRLVMANINAHLMEAACTYGHVAAACGNSVNVVEFLYGLVSWKICCHGNLRGPPQEIRP